MRKRTHKNWGLSMLEMLVVIGIFSVVSSILIFNYGDFRNNVSIRDLAQEVALAVRKAQGYATSVHGITIGGGRDYPAFGIAFAVGQPVVRDFTPDEKEFMIFADVANGANPENKLYDRAGGIVCGNVQPGDECIEQFRISSADKIYQLCTSTDGVTEDCSPQQVNILFHRPNPEADICVVTGSTCDSSKPAYVKIKLRSPGNTVRTIAVWNTGQISVQ